MQRLQRKKRQLKSLRESKRLLIRMYRRVIVLILAAMLSLVLNLLVLDLQKSSATDNSKKVGKSTILQNQTNLLELVEQGRILYKTGRFAEAAAIWQQAASAFSVQEDVLNLAMVLSNLSLAYQQMGKWEKAEKEITSSLELLQINPDVGNSQERLSVLAQALNNQGNLQFALGQTEAALTTWQKATATYAQASDEAGIARSSMNQAQAMQALGLYRRALKTLTETNKLLEQQPDSPLKVAGWRRLGNTLRLVGELEQSRQVLQQSLALAQRLKSASDIAAAWFSLGNTIQAQQNYQAALQFYQQAESASISSSMKIQAQLSQLSLLLKTEEKEAAIALSTKIHSAIADLSPSRTTVYAQIDLADSLLKLSVINNNPLQTENIANLLTKAIQQAKSLGNQQALSYGLGYFGRLYEQNQQWSEAQKLTEEALLIAQASDAPDIAYRWQWQLGRLFASQRRIKEATAAYTEAVASLQSVRRDLVAITPELQFTFRDEVEPVYRQLVDLLLQSQETSEPSQNNLSQARYVIEFLQLAELDNFFRSACLEGQTVLIDEVQQTAAAVIYPIILPDRLEVVLSLPRQPLRHYATPIPQRKVEDTLANLRRNLEKPYTAPEGKSLSQQLYDWLIRPVEDDLSESQVTTLVFILDGALRNVPMSALYNGEKYLVEQYSIALTPGLQLLNPQPLRRRKIEILAGGLTEERHGFSALVNVGRELSQIESELPGQILLNQEFTSTALQNQIGSLSFPVVHLATHGQFSSSAEETFILAWDKPIKVKELDELLRTGEQTRPEVIELLVLSACETAAGDKQAALGLAGVAVQAGARSTLASLWNLDDESGARFFQSVLPRVI